ncbi:MAG: type II/IV secretion system ATPase subunit [Methanoculleaceae archaeon]
MCGLDGERERNPLEDGPGSDKEGSGGIFGRLFGRMGGAEGEESGEGHIPSPEPEADMGGISGRLRGKKGGEEAPPPPGTVPGGGEAAGRKKILNFIRPGRRGGKKAKLKKKAKKFEIRRYSFEKTGPLVEPTIPGDYEEVERYWVQEGLSLVVIALNRRTRQKEYLLYEPVLTEFQYELLERLYEDLRDVLILTDEAMYGQPADVLLAKIYELLDDYHIKLDDEALFKIQYYILRNYLGWGRIDALIRDEEIEDISCDGIGVPIFLYHRVHSNIRTNISFDEESLNSLAITLAQRSGKHISISSPMLDATLPDGSRLQLTLGKEVTSRGTSFTIRKFRARPFSPVELLEQNTFSVDALVYFWMAIENNKNLIFIGGTASGKTTSLNAVSLFIPPLAKVVSIEDTRELTLYHENWIATVTRTGLTETGVGNIDMFDLLKAAMRQRPEYILVGEVRGPEAQTLFQAMSTGHTTLSTMHAGDVDGAIHRLENEPLNVPRNMIQALDVVSLQALVYRGRERVRRCQEIVEVVGIDQVTGNLRVNTVFEYDPVTDLFTYTGRSKVYNEIMAVRGWSKVELDAELERRRRILLAMKEEGIRDYIPVSIIFQAYAINPGDVMENIENLTALLG